MITIERSLLVRAKTCFIRTSLVLGLILLGTSGQQAFATPGMANYTFDVSNGVGTGPFGTATINVISTIQATISFTASPTYSFIGFGFNFNGTVHESGVGNGSITTPVTKGSGIPSDWSLNSNPQMDGFGDFTFEYEGSGASPGSQTLSGTFNITGTDLELSNFTVLSTNASNPPGASVLGAHIFGGDLPGNGKTFYAGVHQTSISETPEPATMTLLAGTAAGLFFLRRRLGFA